MYNDKKLMEGIDDALERQGLMAEETLPPRLSKAYVDQVSKDVADYAVRVISKTLKGAKGKPKPKRLDVKQLAALRSGLPGVVAVFLRKQRIFVDATPGITDTDIADFRRVMGRDPRPDEMDEAKVSEHGLLSEKANVGLWAAFRNAVKADSSLQKRLSDAALDAMARTLKAEGMRYKGHLGGWREEIRLGLTNKANLEMFRSQARGLIEKSTLDLIKKLVL